MNHLAHAFLAADNPDSIAGNLAADWVKGPLQGSFPEPMEVAIAMHRKIDAFVDDHPATASSCATLGLGRYGPIVVDVVNDYLLATSWTDLTPEPLDRFAGRIYSSLTERHTWLPDAFQQRVPSMIANRWLEGFHDLETIDRILRHLARRLRRPGPLTAGIEPVLPHLEPLRAEFLRLLPDTVAFARTLDANAAPLSPAKRHSPAAGGTPPLGKGYPL